MKEWIKDYFTFNRGEQRGLILLLGLLLISILFNYFAPQLVKEKEYDSAEFRAQVEAFLNDSARIVKKNPDKPGNVFPVTLSESQSPLADFLSDPFNFDPNKIGEEEWKKIGLEDRIIRNILKYRQKGGFFRNKEDFRKIYGLDKSVYLLLEPFIDIKVESKIKSPVPFDSIKIENKDTGPVIPEKETSQILDLNTVDSAGLLVLPGIGPSFASRILKYRELLGGYADIAQLMEVKGMDSTRFAGIKDRISVNQAMIRKMDLNSVAFKEMIRHPYFEYYLVKAIFNYKDRIKQYDSVGQIKKIENIYPELFEKIEPYLEVRIPENR